MDFADVSCVLKVDSRCQACKMQVLEVLGSVIGVYSVTMDAPRGLVKISGEVDPNRVLNALAKTGKHAEVVWSKISHPQANRTRHNDKNNSFNYNPGYGNYYDALENPYHSNRTYGNIQLPGYANFQPFYPTGMNDSYLQYY